MCTRPEERQGFQRTEAFRGDHRIVENQLRVGICLEDDAKAARIRIVLGAGKLEGQVRGRVPPRGFLKEATRLGFKERKDDIAVRVLDRLRVDKGGGGRDGLVLAVEEDEAIGGVACGVAVLMLLISEDLVQK